MRRLTLLGIFCAAILVAGTAFADPCPTLVDSTTGCNLIITATDANGGGLNFSIANGSRSGPYEGSEDQVIGVVNNSSLTLASIGLSGSDIFGFDDDGIQTYLSPESCSSGSTTYEGVVNGTSNCTTFNITDSDNGSVLFAGGLAPGQTAYFSLEEPPSTNGFTVTGGQSVPEPASLLLLGTGLLGLATRLRRRKSA